MLRTGILTRRLVNQQTFKTIATSQSRYLTTETQPQTDQPKHEQYGTFRSPASSLGVNDPPVVDHNNWLKRKQQKLRDFVDYEKAFAAHASERRHL
jgi:ATPase complex subunit ATP10